MRNTRVDFASHEQENHFFILDAAMARMIHKGGQIDIPLNAFRLNRILNGLEADLPRWFKATRFRADDAVRLVIEVAPDVSDFARVRDLLPELVQQRLLDDLDYPYLSVSGPFPSESRPGLFE